MRHTFTLLIAPLYLSQASPASLGATIPNEIRSNVDILPEPVGAENFNYTPDRNLVAMVEVTRAKRPIPRGVSISLNVLVPFASIAKERSGHLIFQYI